MGSFSAGLRLEAPVAVPMGLGSASGSRRPHSSTIDVGGNDMMKGTQTTIEITPPTTASTMAPQDTYVGCSRPHSRGICFTPSSAANDTVHLSLREGTLVAGSSMVLPAP